MKAITLWQPWATLVAIGAKRLETRSWSTDFRGPLVIHAAKKRDADLNEMCVSNPRFAYTLKDFRDSRGHFGFPLGCALCVVDLIDVIPLGSLAAPLFSRQERAFGDFSAGRYAWKLDDVRPFPEPIPWRGAQGLWTYDGPLPEVA